MNRTRVILLWIVGISFIIIGFLKYISMDQTSEIFERAHYPRWFFYFVATVEFVGGILLLMTAALSRRLGSILIGIIMLGAMGTRYLVKDNYTHFILPGIIFILAVLMSLDFEKKENKEGAAKH